MHLQHAAGLLQLADIAADRFFRTVKARGQLGDRQAGARLEQF
jgi:hypothetical protein